MDGNHAIGCSLMGLAFTAVLVRVVWMSSPPFNTMAKSKVDNWKYALVFVTVVLTGGGLWLLSLPEDPSIAARNAEEGFQFH